MGYLPQIVMQARDLVGHGLTHRSHPQRMEPTVQRRSAGPLEGSHDLACILGAEDAGFLVGAQVQCGQAIDGEVEEIQRITDPASLHQFFGNNSPSDSMSRAFR